MARRLVGVNFDARTDAVAVALTTFETQPNAGAAIRAVVSEKLQLRLRAVLQNEIQISVAVVIEHGERASIVREIDAAHTRRVGEPSVAIVDVELVAFVTAEAPVGADESIQRLPALLIGFEAFFFRG